MMDDGKNEKTDFEHKWPSDTWTWAVGKGVAFVIFK